MKSPTIGAAMLTVASDASFSDEELLGKRRDDDAKDKDADSAKREASERVSDRAEPRDPDEKPADEPGVTKTNS